MTVKGYKTTGLDLFQSTLPRREWQEKPEGRENYSSFQSTLPRREWHYFVLLKFVSLDFNPHSRVGSDSGADKKIGTAVDFNSHSRVGSDSGADKKIGTAVDFNPHSRVGSDFQPQAQETIQSKFQSTLPRREWLNCNFCFIYCLDFNPHSRVGSDDKMNTLMERRKISIHTPA